MRLHSTLIEKLVRVFTTYGGHKDEKKLREELSKIDIGTYTRMSGETILVDSSDLTKTPKPL